MWKSKEEDKIEKIIRGLLKLPENRRCINCNSLGPQYVCTTFWTFVCTNCSGVHREFTHRVKSISMAKFSMEEVSALQAGGNEKARQIYFKTWDPHCNQIPVTSNIPRIREIIKHVYVDRQYTGVTRQDLVPVSRNSGSYDPRERKRGVSSDRSTSRAKNVDRYSRYSYDEIKFPQQPRENFRYGGLVASPRLESTRSYQVDNPRENSRYAGLRSDLSNHEGRDSRLQVEDPLESSRYGGSRASSCFEVTDGRYQVDNTRVAGRAATQMFTTEDIKPRRRSPDRKESIDMSSPTVSNVKEVLGENSIALRVSNCPKFVDTRSNRPITNARQEGDRHKESHEGRANCKTSHRRTVSANAKDTAAESCSQPSLSNAELKPKSGSSGSLLAIADAPSSSDEPVPKPDPQTNIALESAVNESSRNFHLKNTLEFLLFELSTPAENPTGDHSGNLCDKIAALSSSTREPPTLELVPVLPSGPGDSSHVAAAHEFNDERMSSAPPAAAATTSNTLLTNIPARSTDAHTAKVANCDTMLDLLGGDVVPATEEAGRKEYSSSQHLGHSSTFFADESSTAAQTSHSKDGTNKHPTTLYQAPSSQLDLGSTRETKSSVGTQPSRSDADAGGRKELPAEIFAFPYQSSSMSASGWQAYPNYGMGYNMHYYPPQMQMPPYPNIAKSSNPFDTSQDTIQTHANKFVSKEIVHGGLTNMFNPSGMSHTTNFGSHFMGFASPTGPLAYPSIVQHQPPDASTGTYLGQHSFQQRTSSSNQGAGSFGGELGPTVSLQSNQQIAYGYPAPADQSSFPRGRGNPFG